MYLTSVDTDLYLYNLLICRYQVKPTKKHLNVVKWIFRYLKGTINIGLWHSKDTGMSLTAYSDADHAGYQDTRCSTSGSAQFLGDKLVSWSSKKQKSTTEYQLADIALATRKTQLLDRKAWYEKHVSGWGNAKRWQRKGHEVMLALVTILSINMNPVAAQQVALDNALVALEKRLKIEKCNARIEFSKPQRETTYQVTLDPLNSLHAIPLS
ncbi:hypothetical protein Tco_1540742 [Tanacetum coccineum]